MPTIDWEAVKRMAPEEIENTRLACLEDLTTYEHAHLLVHEELYALTKQIALLEIKKLDIRASLTKSATRIRALKTDIETLRSKFWTTKRETRP